MQVNSHTMVLEWREREHEDENNAAEKPPSYTCRPKKLWIAQILQDTGHESPSTFAGAYSSHVGS
jgi:hypothetical protein